MKVISQDEIKYEPSSIVDNSGKVFYYQNRVFRAILDIDKAQFYQTIMQEKWLSDLFNIGLIKTWVNEELMIKGLPLILEHEKIAFETHPCEWSSQMHWSAAQTLVNISLQLSQHGYLLKDSHPFNFMYCKGHPIFVDFGSIIRQNYVSKQWIDEFRTYFVVPIWLSKLNQKSLAFKYKREHFNGFGLDFFRNKFLLNTLFVSFNNLEKFANRPTLFFKKLNEWLDKNKPSNGSQQTWGNYDQSHQSLAPMSPTTIKQKFVFDILKKEQPLKVLDCAANKGYYSEMAARLGASVVAFDYEEFCVDQCLDIAKVNNLDITPVVMDFRYPTPNHGLGLCGKDAFCRFESDIVLALGLVHHLCLAQNFPVSLFCQICLKYANKGIIWEYVDPSDKYIINWTCQIPRDYVYDNFMYLFSKKFIHHESIDINEDGLQRKLIYFY